MNKMLRSNISVLKEIPKDISWAIWANNEEGGKKFKSVIDYYYSPEYGEADTPTELIKGIVKSIEGAHPLELHEISDWVHIGTSDALTEIINLYLSTNDEFQVSGDYRGFTLITPEYKGLFKTLPDVFGSLLNLPEKSQDMIEAEEEYFKVYGSQDTSFEPEVDELSLIDLFKGSNTNEDTEEYEEYDHDDTSSLIETLEEYGYDDTSLIEALEELEIGQDIEEPQTERRVQVNLNGNIVASDPGMFFSLTEDLIKPKAKQANDSDRLDTITKNGYTVSIDLNEGKVVAYFEKENSERIGVCGKTLNEAIDMFYTMTGRVI